MVYIAQQRHAITKATADLLFRAVPKCCLKLPARQRAAQQVKEGGANVPTGMDTDKGKEQV